MRKQPSALKRPTSGSSIRRDTNRSMSTSRPGSGLKILTKGKATFKQVKRDDGDFTANSGSAVMTPLPGIYHKKPLVRLLQNDEIVLIVRKHGLSRTEVTAIRAEFSRLCNLGKKFKKNNKSSFKIKKPSLLKIANSP
jgi:hypothetical protein